MVTIVSVLFYTEDITLNRIVTTCFIVKLVVYIVNRESNFLLEV
jgi:hypothetical protein